MTVTLYTTGDVAELAGVKKSIASNWHRRGHGPKADYKTKQGIPLWRTLDGWAEWIKSRKLGKP